MKSRYNYTLSPEAVAILRALADKNGVSMSAQLELLIRKSSNSETMTRKELLHQAIRDGKNITTETHAVGGGEWSLEVYADGKFLFELVGPNGTRDGEEPADLHGELSEMWPASNRPIKFNGPREGARPKSTRR